MKGCLKFSAQGHQGSPCISRTPSSSSTLDGPATTPSDSPVSTSSFSASTSTSSQSGSNTPPTTRSRKCVDFGKEICAEFFVADEWDRTPTEPARKLSYQDLLELKEIQRSLPRANQPPDDYAGRAAKCYLRAVPIGLLPLLPDSNPATPMSTPTGTPTSEPSRNPLSASNSPVGSGTSSPMRTASPERGQSEGSSANTATNPPWCVNFHRVRAPPPPVAPAYAPSSSAASALSAAPSLGGSRFAKFPYPPSPLHRGVTLPSAAQAQSEPEPVKDQRLAHLPPGRQMPPRKRPMFAFLPLLDAAEGAGPDASTATADAQEEKEKVVVEEAKKEDEKKKEEAPATSTPKPMPTVLTSTRDASREREDDERTHVEPEWPRHVYGFSSMKPASASASPTSPTSRSPVSNANANSKSGWPSASASAPPTTVSFKRPASDAGRYHGGFGGGYSGYVPPPPVRMVAASGLAMPIKNSLTAHSSGPASQKAKDEGKDMMDKDEGVYYASHMHPYSPGSSRAGSVAGSRSASVERGGEWERRLYAPHATFAAALLRVDELVQRAAADADADEADTDAEAQSGVSLVANPDEERGGRSEKKIPRKTTKTRKPKKEKRFIMVNDMQIELDGSDDEAAEDDAEDEDNVDDDAHVGGESDSGMSLKAALEAPATPPTVYAYQLPTPTPTPPPVLSTATSTATATPVHLRSPAKTPMPVSNTSSSSSSSCLMGDTAGAAGAVTGAGPTVDVEPVRATTPTPINVMEPIRFKRAMPPSPSQMRSS